jgi:carbon monoxide dehydrogenase subunit G
MRFINTIRIDRPQAAVFAYLSDLENLPRWNYAIRETRKITTGPVVVGTRYRQIRTIPVHSEESFEVTEFEPGHKLTIRGWLSSFPAQISYVLHPEGDTTSLTNAVDLQASRPLTMLAPFATHRIKSAVADNLGVLKRILERSGGADPATGVGG